MVRLRAVEILIQLVEEDGCPQVKRFILAAKKKGTVAMGRRSLFVR